MYSKEQGLSSSERKTLFSTLIAECRSCSSFYAYFHLFFISFLFVQLIAFLLFFSYLSKSIACAFSLAVFFLTVFSYFVLTSFFQTKKPEQILAIRERFLAGCRFCDSLQVARATLQGIALLEEEERSLYTKEAFFSALTPIFSKSKIRLHWKNFLAMKETLFILSFEQTILYVKQHPLDLEAHTLLAEIYFSWSLLYLPPKETLAWTPAEYQSEAMQERFFACSSRAIEEFNILKEYGTSNRWLLTQLAKIHELRGEINEQTLQYEELKSLFPEDPRVLAELGQLYFAQGEQSKGLKIYELLKDSCPEEAEEVLSKYSSIAIQPCFS